MKRPQLNFLVDAAAFVLFLLLMSTGLLLRYQLPPGSGELESHGPGRGSLERVVTLLWGQTRHDWGHIHFWISVALIAVLALHLFLHWQWIVGIMRGKPSQASGWRFGIGTAAFAALTVIAFVPLLSPTTSGTRQELLGGAAPAELPAQIEQLRGSASLQDAADASGFAIADLRTWLDLPSDTPADARLGPTLREHGKNMSDARRLLAEHAK
jgi:hypothetical protein